MVVYRKEPTSVQELPVTGITAAEETAHEAGKTPPTSPQMEPRAVLTSRPNSHPFQERHLSLDQPVKVGRSVARCRPAHYNAIFDCKVLSRNHALLWYENGKFYLQDTKSSNGTFVNNQRLSKGSEESPAREVCSGDIVQFGVDVVENSRKVVHGCIVATLKLYLPDGKEAKASPTTTVVPLSPETSVSSQELYQLSQYLQEALHREQILENKLGTLQKVVANTQDESDIGWKALIEEDRLLSRIETLESQLQTCSKNVTEEKLKDDVMKLQEDKDKYQIAAKESLKKVLQEKLEAIRKVQDLENSLSNTENECTHLGEMNQKKEQEIQLLLEKSTESEKEIANLTTKLQELEEKYQDMLSQSAEDKLVLENNTEEMKKEEQILSARIEALQAENDFAKEQLSAMKAHFDIIKKDNDPDETIERNGNLSSDDHIDSAEETERKLIQHLSREVNRLSLELERVRTENRKNEAHLYTDNEDFKTNGDAKPSNYINKLQADILQLKKVLNETRDSKKVVDVELLQVRAQLDQVQTNAKKVSAELRNVQEQLSTARQQVKEKTEQVLELECKLLSLIKEKESDSEKELGKEMIKDGSYAAKETSSEAQGPSQNFGIEALDKQSQLKSLSAMNNFEEECALHKEKVRLLEADLIKCSVENSKLEALNRSLKDLCERLEAAKSALEQRDGDYWNEHTVISKLELASSARKLLDAQEEIIVVKERYEECNKEKSYLQGELNSLKEQLELLSVQSKTVSVCSVIPLIILAVAIMLAFYPTLSHLTATFDQP